MASREELRAERLKKLRLLREKGIEPYPSRSERTGTIVATIDLFEKLVGKSATLAGRVTALRKHGGVVFVDLADGSGGSIQGLVRADSLAGNAYELFNETVDNGDFIEIAGTLLITRRGEKSIEAISWRMLAKSLLPVPAAHFGIENEEERLRKRYLDILLRPELRAMIERRARFWSATRTFLAAEGFLEVETPVLEHTTGGADARPFATRHHALQIPLYLRISAGELWQKRLMVAGFTKVFEIGRIFRNEGMSHEHAQDYTQMEFYMAYADYHDGMKLVERMYRHIAQEVFGTLVFTIGEYHVDLSRAWEDYDYTDTIQRITGVDIRTASLEELTRVIEKQGMKHDRDGWNHIRAIDTLWKHCRKKLAGPGFLVNVPKEMSPLAKTHRDDPTRVEQFQVIIAGSENGKGYSELNDPIDQAVRFEAQAALREMGDEEAQMFDRDFVEALEYGMPPTCGFGFSERLFSFLSNVSIREAQIFPLLKPKP
ncbi:MAG: lysine--tRNA ligase [Candidatus Vogelbacteria bacterium]|nr:lysine--tRNA ligase [Candidatus Vogelbacteria bacterium]